MDIVERYPQRGLGRRARRQLPRRRRAVRDRAETTAMPGSVDSAVAISRRRLRPTDGGAIRRSPGGPSGRRTAAVRSSARSATGALRRPLGSTGSTSAASSTRRSGSQPTGSTTCFIADANFGILPR
jgi:hypothetical protein